MPTFITRDERRSRGRREQRHNFTVDSDQTMQTRAPGAQYTFQPDRLDVTWGTWDPEGPGQLDAVHVTGLRLNKDGRTSARLIRDYRHFHTSDHRLAEDTPDWVRSAVVDYWPDWCPRPEWLVTP